MLFHICAVIWPSILYWTNYNFGPPATKDPHVPNKYMVLYVLPILQSPIPRA